MFGENLGLAFKDFKEPQGDNFMLHWIQPLHSLAQGKRLHPVLFLIFCLHRGNMYLKNKMIPSETFGLTNVLLTYIGNKKRKRLSV